MLYKIFILLSLVLTSCTVTFENISTHGTATDLVDQTQQPTTNAEIPVRL